MPNRSATTPTLTPKRAAGLSPPRRWSSMRKGWVACGAIGRRSGVRLLWGGVGGGRQGVWRATESVSKGKSGRVKRGGDYEGRVIRRSLVRHRGTAGLTFFAPPNEPRKVHARWAIATATLSNNFRTTRHANTCDSQPSQTTKPLDLLHPPPPTPPRLLYPDPHPLALPSARLGTPLVSPRLLPEPLHSSALHKLRKICLFLEPRQQVDGRQERAVLGLRRARPDRHGGEDLAWLGLVARPGWG